MSSYFSYVKKLAPNDRTYAGTRVLMSAFSFSQVKAPVPDEHCLYATDERCR